MGVLGKIAAAAKSAARNSAVAVAYRDGLMFGDDEVVGEGVTVYRDGRAMSEKELMEARAAAKARRDREARRQDLLRQLLEVDGANVEAIDAARVLADARDIADGLCRARIGEAAEPREPLIDWRPLTKAGKLPKCVARATAVWDRQNGDCVIAHLGYTADARPYTADVHIWTDGERYSYKVRTVGGDLAVTGEGPA